MKTSCGLAILILGLLTSTLVYAAHPEINLLPNAGFENKLSANWSNWDSCRFESSARGQHSGKRSLAFYPLRDGAGVRCDVSAILQPGFRYAFTSWFRNAELGWGQVDVLLNYQQAGQSKQVFIGRADCDKFAWTTLANQFVIPEQAEKTKLDLVIKTGWGRNSFFVDDIELRPALQVAVHRPFIEQIPELVMYIGPHNVKRAELKAQVCIMDAHSKPVKEFVQPLNEAYAPSLSDGYYRVTVQAQDLDGRSFSTEKILYIGLAKELVKNLDHQIETILSNPTLIRYHGWIKYLHFLTGFNQKQEGAEGERTLQALYRLNKWIFMIKDHPALLDTLRGVQEWAYLSQVDDSGQPFKIAIPTLYDARKSYPLVVVMHGYGGNHMEYSGGVKSNPDYFELHVLGRARGGGYYDLSEADVLDAVDYIRANWRIDDRRIHLTGASMGGGGTFKMASRYPDRWASGRPVCGYASDQAIENSLHVPLYSTHSQDDPTVPVLTSRAPLQKLLSRGGQVVLDETNGLQHAAWNYHEGNDRALQWMYLQVRPEFNQMRHIDFTARDRYSCAAYWLKVAEWGSMPGPAHFKAIAGPDNQLYLTCDNIRALLMRIKQSPFDQQQELKVSVNGKVPISMKAPLADSILLKESGGTWSLQAENDLPIFILHTPGGVHNLYNREPLLIVYGTDGDATARTALVHAAAAASKSVHPTWVSDGGDIKEGVAHHQLLYGHLKIKPDTAVSASDLKKYHLVLIGKASENRLVRKMQNHLPVQFDKDIVCSDGVRLPGTASLMGLYFFNPLAPARLIYWVAADNPAAYRANNMLLQIQDDAPCGVDLLVVQDNPFCLVKTRHFDSRWNWIKEFEKTARIDKADNTFGRLYERLADAIRITTGAGFCLQAVQAPPELTAGVLGVTQWADFAALDMTTSLAIFRVKGSEMQSYQQDFSKAGLPFHFYPTVDDKIEPEKIYVVGMTAGYWQIQQLINLHKRIPESFEMLDVTLFEAMQRTLF